MRISWFSKIAKLYAKISVIFIYLNIKVALEELTFSRKVRVPFN